MKVKYRLHGRDKEIVSDYFRKMGMSIGKHCNIVSNITTSEPYLISLGDNTTLSAGVALITHDNCVSKIVPNTTDLFGKISIGNNCFIGNRAMVLYGVSIADNVVVAAGSVVTKSILKSNIIVAGNPAREVGTWESFLERYTDNAFNLDEIPREELRRTIETSDKLIRK